MDRPGLQILPLPWIACSEHLPENTVRLECEILRLY